MLRSKYGNHGKQGPIQKLKNLFIPKDLPATKSAMLSLENENGLHGQDIVTLSTQDWLDLWTRKQRFMLQFARQENKVLYVESQYHWLTYIRRLKWQWRRIYLFLLGPREVEPNLFIFTPPLILPAFQIFPVIAKLNNFVLAFFLRSAMKKIGVKEPLLWLYSHFNEPLIKKLGAKRALYECVDEFSGAKGLINGNVAREQERATLRAVDAAIVTAPGLKKSKVGINRNIHVVPNAANVAHFGRVASGNLPQPADLDSLSRPRLVFIGAIAYWIDLELLRFIAEQRPTWQLVLVGPVLVNISSLDGIPNIHFLGRKPYEFLPDYLAWCDVALNPYKIDSVAENCSPLKIYEYMAAGLPTVSTDMPEAKQFPGLISIAKDYADFVLKTEELLNRTDVMRNSCSISCRNEAQKHSWEMRFLEVEKIAEGVL
jgi:glycosyltransferase involved in cell wall biosynthesis